MHRDMEFNEIMLILFFFNRIKAQRMLSIAWISGGEHWSVGNGKSQGNIPAERCLSSCPEGDAPGPCCSGFTMESTKTISYYGLFTVVHALSLPLTSYQLTLNPVNTTLWSWFYYYPFSNTVNLRLAEIK